MKVVELDSHEMRLLAEFRRARGHARAAMKARVAAGKEPTELDGRMLVIAFTCTPIVETLNISVAVPNMVGTHILNTGIKRGRSGSSFTERRKR